MSIRGFNVYGDVQRYDFNFLDNIPSDIGGVSDWLIAEYGVTSGSEITEAINNGKAVAVLVNGNVFTLSKSVSSSGSGTTYYFTRVSGTTSSEISVNGTTWTSAIDTELSFRDAFWAEFGTTTADEIRAKANGAKIVLLKYNGVTYYLSNITSSSGNFVCTFVSSTGQNVYTITVTGGVWGAPVIVNLARIDSPALTGVPTAPTADAGTTSNQIATTQFVQRAVIAAGGLPSGGITGQWLTIVAGVPKWDDLPIADNNLKIFEFTVTEQDGPYVVTSGPTPLTVIGFVDGMMESAPVVVAEVSMDGKTCFLPVSAWKTGSTDAFVEFCGFTSDGYMLDIKGGVVSGTWIIDYFDQYEAAYQQIYYTTGYPNDLTTTNKSNLVAAINELNAGKQAKNLGAANAGKFLVVGSDGNITAVTMTTWQGGSF